jgi:RNA polymerase sigma-70 factor (ECF subfamily)
LLEPAGTAGVFDTIEEADVTDEDDARADFDARFALARDRLLRIAGSLVGAEEADDVVHDSYLLGRQRFDQLRDASAFESWQTRIVVNQCFGRHRRTRRLRELLPAMLPGRAAGTDLGLRDLVERLPPRERTVLVLHYGHGYGLEEIAGMLDLTHTNVRTIIARTRKRLFQAWRTAEGLDR